MKSNFRKRAFTQLTKNAEQVAKVAKFAQQIANETSSVDPEAYAEEYTKKLFMKLWDNTEIHLIGDE